LTACADTSTTPPTQTAPATTAAPTITNAASPNSEVASTTTTGSTQTANLTTQAATTAPATTANSPTVPPTAAPTPVTNTPVPPTATAPPFTPTLKMVGPANSGYYFTFAADGRLVFYARANNQAGSWAATIGNPDWQFLAPGFGNFTSDLSLAALSDKAAGTTLVTRLDGNKTLATLRNRGSATIFSPADQSGGQQVAYLLRSLQQDGPEEPQHFELWVANLDGSQARAVWTGLEAANLAWFPAGRKLMWTGRDSTNQKFGLWVQDIAKTTQSATAPAYTIIASKGVSVASLSPDGQWVAYWVTLQGDKFSGVWLARSDGSQAQKLDWLGGFRWADTGELLYLPVRRSNETARALWSYSPKSGKSTRLTDPAQTPLKVALDQWQVAPGAKSIVFRNAADNSLWQCVFRA